MLELNIEFGADALMEIDIHRHVTATVAASGAVMCDVLPDNDDVRTAPTGPNTYQIKDCLPNNCVILTSVEGRSYIPTTLYAELIRSVALPNPFESIVDGVSADSVEELNTTEYVELLRTWSVLCDEKQALSASIDAAKSELAALLGPCTTAYADHTTVETIEDVRALEHERDALKTKLTSERTLLAEAVSVGRDAVHWATGLQTQHLPQLEATVRALKSSECTRAIADLQCAQGLLDSRSLSLAAQVFELYPIVVDSLGYYSIHGAKLPPLNKMSEFEEDEVSTALGSRMKDDVYPSQPLSDGPLFSKGVDQKAFVAGLKMLERNVAQILNSQGLHAKPDEHMLSCLMRLFELITQPHK